jgi:hypothetical protein
MRTITEFSGFTIKSGAQARARLTQEGVAPEQLPERLGSEVGVTGDRLARLIEALEAVGGDAERVRLVRVFAASDEPRGAKQVGEFKYLVDFQPQAGGAPRDDRKRGGDRGRGDRGRGGGGGDRGRGGGDRGPGGFKPKQPMGLKSLSKAAKQATGEAPRPEREERGPMPSVGQGWMLTRAPGDAGDHRRKGKGPRRGKPGDKRGDKRGGDRPRGPRPPGQRPEGARPPGQRPEGARPPGQRPEGARPPGEPGDPQKKRRRRRRGRGGGGGPRPQGAPPQQNQNQPQASAPKEPALPPPPTEPPKTE